MVEFRGFDHGIRDALQPREVDEEARAGDPGEVREKNREFANHIDARPIPELRLSAHRGDDVVHEARAPEHDIFPNEEDDEGRDQNRDDEKDAEERRQLLALEIVKKLGEEDRHEVAEDHAEQGEDHHVLDANPEHGVLEDLDVVRNAHENRLVSFGRGIETGIREGIEERLDRGVIRENEKESQRNREPQESAPLVFMPLWPLFVLGDRRVEVVPPVTGEGIHLLGFANLGFRHRDALSLKCPSSRCRNRIRRCRLRRSISSTSRACRSLSSRRSGRHRGLASCG